VKEIGDRQETIELDKITKMSDEKLILMLPLIIEAYLEKCEQ
jgi:hypothetical protein